jgi:predicted negative regulator of RcsB-dependent stress response
MRIDALVLSKINKARLERGNRPLSLHEAQKALSYTRDKTIEHLIEVKAVGPVQQVNKQFDEGKNVLDVPEQREEFKPKVKKQKRIPKNIDNSID